MSRLPEIVLDDRRFQDLVSEARTRIAQLCPEWTEHNVSDPGITLIELFAWMTEMVTYRLDHVPDKVHVELLDLLGVRLRAGSAARTDIRFRLTAPPVEPVTLDPRSTEVGTIRTAQEESTVFQLVEGRVIEPLVPSAYVLTRRGEIRSVSVEHGIARPVGGDRAMFSAIPQVGDALHLGFDEEISRLLVEVEVEVESARGTGITPTDPPLRWEFAAGEDRWEPAPVLEDTTEGFNGSGNLLVELPGRSARIPVGGQRLHWLRCTVVASDSAEAYQASPSVLQISAQPLGAILPAHHATHVDGEVVGSSDGTPAQSFEVLHPPMLKPAEDEWLEVRDPDTHRWERWQHVETFAESGARDRHYTLDLANGVVELGPAVRRRDGSWEQFGEVPPPGAQLRLVRYRHGGGLEGNVAPHTLTVLKEGPAGIAAVTNPRTAAGGVDPEVLDDARERGAMELRARHRAVTREDFEHLAREATPRVARAICVPPEEGTSVGVRILPHVHPADRRIGYGELRAPRDLLEEVASHLDSRRLLGATLDVAEVRLRGIAVVLEVQTEPLADVVRIQSEVEYELYRYLNPLVGGVVGGFGPGWEFGRTLNQGELYGVVHDVSGIEYVRMLRIYEVDLRTGRQSPEPAGSHVVLAPDESIASARHQVKTVVRGT